MTALITSLAFSPDGSRLASAGFDEGGGFVDLFDGRSLPVHRPPGRGRAHRRARAARLLLAGLARARSRSPVRHLQARVPLGRQDRRCAPPDGDARRGLAGAVRLHLRRASRDGGEGRHHRSRRRHAAPAASVPRRRRGDGVKPRRRTRRVRGARRLGSPARPADRRTAHGRRPPRGTGGRDALQLPRRPARHRGHRRAPDRVGPATGDRRRDARRTRDRAISRTSTSPPTAGPPTAPAATAR